VHRKPPQPLAQSFLVCREIFQDRQTGEYILLAPLAGAAFGAFPAAFRLSLYIKLTGAHGAYRMELQLRDQDDRLLGECSSPHPVQQDDPLATCQISWRDLVLRFPQPGKYDLVLLANGEDLSHHSFGFQKGVGSLKLRLPTPF
jgi:hypothetical protein